VPIESYSHVQSLKPGARVALVAPSGPLRGPDDLARAESNVRAYGWEPVVGAYALARLGYFAGDDVQRLDDLNRALDDVRVDAIWCLRGGYGITRILDGVNYDALRRRPRPVIGYSDVTALLCAIGRECKIVTYHAPTAREVVTPFSRNSFERAIVYGEDSCGVAHGARVLRSGRADGRLMGGNLALLAALCGTRYMPNLHDAILVLEDVNEPAYRVDRMLRQLLMAGALTGVTAIAFGQCTSDERPDAPGEALDAHEALDAVVREMAELLDVPCVSGLPVGHINEQWTIPFGCSATLDADGLSLHVHARTSHLGTAP
jgi:muramoyltetrapeptide carboxypeptidase